MRRRRGEGRVRSGDAERFGDFIIKREGSLRVVRRLVVGSSQSFLLRSFFLSDPRFLFSSLFLFAFSACFATFIFFALMLMCCGKFDARFTHACIFSSASSTFCFCVRKRLDWITSSPSLFTLFFSSTRNRLATQGWSQSSFFARSSRMSTFVFTLLTFCPPAPPDLANVTSTSSLVNARGGSVFSPGSGIGKSSLTLGP